jgi:hypothetical protein
VFVQDTVTCVNAISCTLLKVINWVKLCFGEMVGIHEFNFMIVFCHKIVSVEFLLLAFLTINLLDVILPFTYYRKKS